VPHKTFEGVAACPTVEQAHSINQALRDTVKVVLIGAYFNPVHPDRQKAALGEQTFVNYIKLAKDLGGSVVGSESGSYNGDVWDYHPGNRTPQAMSIVVDTFGRLCDVATQYDVQVGLEGAAGHCLYSVQAMHQAILSIDRANLKVIFDLYNMLEPDNAMQHMRIAEQAVDKFGGRIHAFHIKDCFYKSGKILQVRPGAGELQLREYLGMIRDYDKHAKLVLEGVTGDDIMPAVNFVRECI
jgi:sugar phosphate isomerase/epimerase